ERDYRLSVHAFEEPALQLDRGANRPASGREHAKGLVAAELEQRTAGGRHGVARQLREPARELRGGLVPVLIRESGVSADVGDQERPQVRGVVEGLTRRRIELHAGESTERQSPHNGRSKDGSDGTRTRDLRRDSWAPPGLP